MMLVGCGEEETTVNIETESPEIKIEEPITGADIEQEFEDDEGGMFYLKSGEVKWTGSKLTSSHWGTIDLVSAVAEINDTLDKGTFVLDMNSIKSGDLEGPGAEGLINHLKSEDFFDVANHGTAILEVKGAEKKDGEDRYEMTANLTIKGITNEILFDAVVKANEEGDIVSESDITIDRTKWDIRYGSGKFFEDIGDKLIKDEVSFEVSVVLTGAAIEEESEDDN